MHTGEQLNSLRSGSLVAVLAAFMKARTVGSAVMGTPVPRLAEGERTSVHTIEHHGFIETTAARMSREPGGRVSADVWDSRLGPPSARERWTSSGDGGG